MTAVTGFTGATAAEGFILILFLFFSNSTDMYKMKVQVKDLTRKRTLSQTSTEKPTDIQHYKP